MRMLKDCEIKEIRRMMIRISRYNARLSALLDKTENGERDDLLLAHEHLCHAFVRLVSLSRIDEE